MSNFRCYVSSAVLLFLFTFRTISCQDWVVQDDGCRTPDRGVGNCISAKKCKPMVDFLLTMKRPFSTFVVNRLNAYSCGYMDGELHVCCPSNPIVIVDPSTSPRTPSTPTGPPDVSNHGNRNLLPEECGHLDSTDKIRNGINATLNEFPWMALLSYRTKRGPEFKCGGTVINERYILTAAHCVTNLKDPLIGVRVGEHDISLAKDCEMSADRIEKCNPPVQDVGVEEIISHEKYSKDALINDIGLVRVNKMDLTKQNARPVCLPLGDTSTQKFSYAVVTGWGYTGNGDKSSNILQRVDLPVVNLTECKKVYESQQNVRLTDSQMCAGGKDQKDSCSGDSGGPLHAAAYVNDDTRYVQQGIVSFGPRFCGLDGFPGVYTKVAFYMDWILNKMKP